MNIREVIGTLNAMQAEGVIERYAIGGAIGATFYLEPLDTFDVDVFVRFPAQPGSLLVSLQPIFDDLARRGFAMEGNICGRRVARAIPAADRALVEDPGGSGNP